jgi:hypothetical protein
MERVAPRCVRERVAAHTVVRVVLELRSCDRAVERVAALPGAARAAREHGRTLPGSLRCAVSAHCTEPFEHVIVAGENQVGLGVVEQLVDRLHAGHRSVIARTRAPRVVRPRKDVPVQVRRKLRLHEAVLAPSGRHIATRQLGVELESEPTATEVVGAVLVVRARSAEPVAVVAVTT